MKKCDRCGEDRFYQEGHLLKEASGVDATETYTLQGRDGVVTASVCKDCGNMLAGLGWVN